MTGLQNLHTHTTYCDGALPPEDMIKAAIKMGCGSIGFSEHSHVTFDIHYSMTPDVTRKYIREINALKEKYKGVIDVFLGLELDYYSDELRDGLDYSIGTVHYISAAGEFTAVDAGEKNVRKIVRSCFGGDAYLMIESYYELVAKVIKKTNADIVGHFDLVEKYNFGGCLFDEAHPRYRSAALGAMDEILKDCRLFEVNTGAMYRISKPGPYPSAFLLKELRSRGGEVILSSDSHDAKSLCYKFGEMRELLKACGFDHIKRLTYGGFVEVKI